MAPKREGWCGLSASVKARTPPKKWLRWARLARWLWRRTAPRSSRSYPPSGRIAAAAAPRWSITEIASLAYIRGTRPPMGSPGSLSAAPRWPTPVHNTAPSRKPAVFVRHPQTGSQFRRIARPSRLADRRRSLQCTGRRRPPIDLIRVLKGERSRRKANETAGWQPAWLPLFRRAGRVYVALGVGALRPFSVRPSRITDGALNHHAHNRRTHAILLFASMEYR